jgi:hypothetical protein
VQGGGTPGHPAGRRVGGMAGRRDGGAAGQRALNRSLSDTKAPFC